MTNVRLVTDVQLVTKYNELRDRVVIAGNKSEAEFKCLGGAQKYLRNIICEVDAIHE